MTGSDVQGQRAMNKEEGMDRDKDRKRDRVTGTDVQGQRNGDKEEGDG